MKRRRYLLLLGFLLVAFSFGCSNRPPQHTAEGEKVEMLLRNVSVYRKKPHILAAKGRLVLTDRELIFTPTPYFWVLHLHGTEATVVQISDIEEVQRKQWRILYPFRVDLFTSDGNSYPIVTVRREKFIRELERVRQELGR